MKICRAKPGDEAAWREAVFTLVPGQHREHRLVTVEELGRALHDPRCYLFLALVESDIVGLLSAYQFPDVEAGGRLVYLYDIEVSLAHRRRGIGSALIHALIDECRKDGVLRIWAGTDTANHAARRTFELTEAELEGDQYLEYVWDLD